MLISPSGSPIWLKCFASPKRSAIIGRNGTNEEAKEGTFAHLLGEQCLKNNLPTSHYIQAKGIIEGTQFSIDREMAAHVQIYVDETIRTQNQGAKPSIFIEKRVRVFKGLRGTPDHVVVYPMGILFVNDLKFGRKIVEPSSPQLKIYALGFIGETNPFNVRIADLGIIQPRVTHPHGPVRRFQIPVEDLIRWKNETLKPAINEIYKPDPPATPGEHCLYCDAKIICPELLKMIFALIGTPTDMKGHPVSTDTKKTQLLSDQELGQLMKMQGVLDRLAKEIYGEALRRYQSGIVLSGYKMVKGRGSKAWKSPELVKAALSNVPLCESIYTEPELRSPAQILAVLKDSGFQNIKGFMVEHINITHGRKLVPDDDPRPTTRLTFEEMFK